MEQILEGLCQANSTFDQRYPGNPGQRQPVHTVYGGAQRFKSDTVRKLGGIARETLRAFVPDSKALCDITGMDAEISRSVHNRVAAKLEREPVEDFRIDFEDGYGEHSDAEEDTHAVDAAAQLARGMRDGTLPPFIGIRIKPLSTASHRRAVRTLDLFLANLLANDAELPPDFVVTLPKVTIPAQVTALDQLLRGIEARFSLLPGTIAIEVMVETPQIIIDRSGTSTIPSLIDAAAGRCRGLHFGPYDYTTSIGITASQQSLHHPACDFARHTMQAAAAGTGVFLSDGPTKLIPIPPHRGPSLTQEQAAANREAVHHAMRAHFNDVRRSLKHGFYQGWDLHPAQFPMRYAAVYAFFLEGVGAAASRLRNFMESAARATTLGTQFDDTASAQGLLNFFLQGWSCGALVESDIAATGLTLAQIRQRSFAKMLSDLKA